RARSTSAATPAPRSATGAGFCPAKTWTRRRAASSPKPRPSGRAARADPHDGAASGPKPRSPAGELPLFHVFGEVGERVGRPHALALHAEVVPVRRRAAPGRIDLRLVRLVAALGHGAELARRRDVDVVLRLDEEDGYRRVLDRLLQPFPHR